MADPTPNPSPAPPAPDKPVFTLLTPISPAVLLVLALGVVAIGFCAWWYFAPLTPDLTVPSQVTGNPGEYITVTGFSKGNITWYAPDAGLSVFPSHMLRDNNTAVVVAKSSGKYRLVAFAAHHGQIYGPMSCMVVVGDVPPGPGPGPGPSDPFFAVLQAAYTQETGATKAADVGQLAALYDAASKAVNTSTLATVGDFHNDFQSKVDSLVAKTALPQVRAAIGTNLNAVLPRPVTAPLDATAKSIISQNFSRIAADLIALK